MILVGYLTGKIHAHRWRWQPLWERVSRNSVLSSMGGYKAGLNSLLVPTKHFWIVISELVKKFTFIAISWPAKTLAPKPHFMEFFAFPVLRVPYASLILPTTSVKTKNPSAQPLDLSNFTKNPSIQQNAHNNPKSKVCHIQNRVEKREKIQIEEEKKKFFFWFPICTSHINFPCFLETPAYFAARKQFEERKHRAKHPGSCRAALKFRPQPQNSNSSDSRAA